MLYRVVMIFVYIADFVFKISGKNLLASLSCVKKFNTSTEYKSSANRLDSFNPLFPLGVGIERMLEC